MSTTAFLFVPVLAAALLATAGGSDSDSLSGSTSRGARWVLSYSSRDPEMYYGLAFANPTHGWIVGDSGRILHSRDAGSTWESQPSPTANRLMCVQFVSAGCGWAAGEGNTAVSTRDGGVSWTLGHPPGEPGQRTFMAMQFVDEQEAWLCHNNGGLVHTRDGGLTWSAHDGLAREALVSMCFLDARKGWVLGVRGTLLRTEDGGQTWATQHLTTQPLAVASFSTLFFLDGANGWIGTDTGISSRAGETPPLFRTTDEGRTWLVEGRWPGMSVRCVWFRDAQSGWCAELGGLYSTADGGRSWVKERDSGGDPFVQMAFIEESQGWALTFLGNVYRYSK